MENKTNTQIAPAPTTPTKATALKVFDVVDKKTGLIWKSDRNHNATTFNNHEVVRPTANTMALIQAKYGINVNTMNAKKYTAYLYSQALGFEIPSSEFLAPMPEVEQPVVQPVVEVQPVQAVADTTDKKINDWIFLQQKTGKWTDDQIRLTMSKQMKMSDNVINTYFVRTDMPPLPQ